MKVYLKSYSRISPLHPDPDYKSMFSMMEARRMSKLMKRAVAVSSDALAKAGLEMPDAIVAGTGYGCIENTEAFIKSVLGLSDQPVRPTWFMQSTHNTVSSLIAIRLGCHGYNSTYSHSTVSFESALLDAFLQIGLGDIDTALVGAFEESTEGFCDILEKAGNSRARVGGEPSFTAASFVLSSDPAGAVCEVEDVHISRRGCLPAMEGTVIARDSYIEKYGDNLSVSALGACDAAELLASGGAGKVTIVNESEGRPSAYIRLAAI